jgi:D-alanyl-D-alanine carboxypeptidase
LDEAITKEPSHMSKRPVFPLILVLALSFAWGVVSASAAAKEIRVNARSAMLVELATGRSIYEQNADAAIAPASITKVLTLYLVFEAIREGRLHLWDNVKVSSRAAQTGGSRMGLRNGDIVPVGELIKGMAVVSGNDACVAIAEHMSGSVEAFVEQMNAKARQLGMNDSTFNTPNGLPSKGQLTTARDIAKLSVTYLRRFPESLNIHSMQSYTYRTTTHRNANRLLGTCQGVDGLKTGFVCAAGYNLTATAVRGDHRLVAVVLGAPSPGIRAAETAKLLQEGYDTLNGDTVLVQAPADLRRSCPVPERDSTKVARKSGKQRGKSRQTVVAETPQATSGRTKISRVTSNRRRSETAGSDSAQAMASKKSSVASAPSKTGKPAESAGSPHPKALKTDGDAVSANPKKHSSHKAQIATTEPAANKNPKESKPSKVGSKQPASSDKTTDAKKRSTNGHTEKVTAPEKQKASTPPPAIRKLSPVQKSSAQPMGIRPSRC